MTTTKLLEQLQTEFTESIISEIENTFQGSVVADLDDCIAVVSLGRILAITPKTKDPHDDVDRLCGFLYYMIQSGGRVFTPLGE